MEAAAAIPSARLLARLDAGELAVPTLPEAAMETLRELDRPNADARRLAAILRTDAGFAGEVLRTASSALFGGGAPIVSLPQAIARLGFQRIKELAILVAARAKLTASAALAGEVRALLRHSLATAILAQEIARLRRSRVEEAFLAGLLHDLGRLVLLAALRDDIAADRAAPPSVWLGLTDELHGRAGALLCARWGLPRSIGDAVAAHHAPHGDELALVIALADRLAHDRLADREAPVEDHHHAAALNLYPEDLEQILARTGDLAAAVSVIG